MITQPPVGVITFLDVLGWKGVYNRMKDAIGVLSSLITELHAKSEEYRGQDNIGVTVVHSISDTIVICTSVDRLFAEKAIGIHGELCRWLIPKTIAATLPIRGAISFGEYENKNNIFVGKGIDEAAAWHEQSDWIGVHLTPSAEFCFGGKTKIGWRKYQPPTKIRHDWMPYCVDWTLGWIDRKKEIANIKNSFEKLGPIIPDIANKFLNTIKFIERVNDPVTW